MDMSPGSGCKCIHLPPAFILGPCALSLLVAGVYMRVFPAPSDKLSLFLPLCIPPGSGFGPGHPPLFGFYSIPLLHTALGILVETSLAS